jgi:hypothetical protein
MNKILLIISSLFYTFGQDSPTSNPTTSPLLSSSCNSRTYNIANDFSGTQGANGWYYGYNNGGSFTQFTHYQTTGYTSSLAWNYNAASYGYITSNVIMPNGATSCGTPSYGNIAPVLRWINPGSCYNDVTIYLSLSPGTTSVLPTLTVNGNSLYAPGSGVTYSNYFNVYDIYSIELSVGPLNGNCNAAQTTYSLIISPMGSSNTVKTTSTITNSPKSSSSIVSSRSNTLSATATATVFYTGNWTDFGQLNYANADITPAPLGAMTIANCQLNCWLNSECGVIVVETPCTTISLDDPEIYTTVCSRCWLKLTAGWAISADSESKTLMLYDRVYPPTTTSIVSKTSTTSIEPSDSLVSSKSPSRSPLASISSLKSNSISSSSSQTKTSSASIEPTDSSLKSNTISASSSQSKTSTASIDPTDSIRATSSVVTYSTINYCSNFGKSFTLPFIGSSIYTMTNNIGGSYTNNLGCWVLIYGAGNSQQFRVNISSLSTEPCCDFFSISNSAGTQIVRYSGSTGSGTSFMVSGTSFIRIDFTSDGSSVSSGVFATISLEYYSSTPSPSNSPSPSLSRSTSLSPISTKSLLSSYTNISSYTNYKSNSPTSNSTKTLLNSISNYNSISVTGITSSTISVSSILSRSPTSYNTRSISNSPIRSMSPSSYSSVSNSISGSPSHSSGLSSSSCSSLSNSGSFSVSSCSSVSNSGSSSASSYSSLSSSVSPSLSSYTSLSNSNLGTSSPSSSSSLSNSNLGTSSPSSSSSLSNSNLGTSSASSSISASNSNLGTLSASSSISASNSPSETNSPSYTNYVSLSMLPSITNYMTSSSSVSISSSNYTTYTLSFSPTNYLTPTISPSPSYMNALPFALPAKGDSYAAEVTNQLNNYLNDLLTSGQQIPPAQALNVINNIPSIGVSDTMNILKKLSGLVTESVSFSSSSFEGSLAPLKNTTVSVNSTSYNINIPVIPNLLPNSAITAISWSNETSFSNESTLSNIMSVSVSSKGVDSKISNLSQPIILHWKISNIIQPPNTTLKCSYWNYTSSSWRSDGCVLLSNLSNSDGIIECSCDHMTDFVARFERIAEMNSNLFGNAANVYSLEGLEKYKSYYILYGCYFIFMILCGIGLQRLDIKNSKQYLKALKENIDILKFKKEIKHFYIDKCYLNKEDIWEFDEYDHYIIRKNKLTNEIYNSADDSIKNNKNFNKILNILLDEKLEEKRKEDIHLEITDTESKKDSMF